MGSGGTMTDEQPETVPVEPLRELVEQWKDVEHADIKTHEHQKGREQCVGELEQVIEDET